MQKKSIRLTLLGESIYMGAHNEKIYSEQFK